MSGRTALEDEDLSPRQAGAEMVEAAAVAKAELHHDAGDRSNLLHRPIEAGALRLQAADGLVEAGEVLRSGGHFVALIGRRRAPVNQAPRMIRGCRPNLTDCLRCRFAPSTTQAT